MTRIDLEDNAGQVRVSLDEAMNFHAAGDLDRAEKQYVQVLSKEYRTTDVLPLLAGVVTKRGDYEMALYYWDKLLAINPTHLTALLEKGGLLRSLKRLDEALDCYQLARDIAPRNAVVRNNLAVTVADLGRKDEALAAFDDVLKIQPGNVNAYHQIRRLSSSMVPFWHVVMMNDARRNDALDAAIRRAVAKRGEGAKVLDIGSGSGLLSMMAARAGATDIVTCESVSLIARTAEAIIADNGYADRIKLVNKPSGELTVDGKTGDLDRRADILVSEVLSSDLLAENVIITFEDAHRRLIAEDATVIPRAVSAMGCLVYSETLTGYSTISKAAGFDVSRFKPLAPIRLPVHGTMGDWKRLSDDFVITALDLTLPNHEAQLRPVKVPVTASGTVTGVVQWIKIDLIDEITFDNHPENGEEGGWLQVFHPFPEPVEVAAGNELTMLLGHDRASLIALPAGLKA